MPILDGRHILWVDDLHSEASASIELLRQSGARIDLAGNMTQAVECLGRNDYDLAVIDLDLSHGKDREIPVTLLSVQRKYDLYDVRPDSGILLATWIYEYKRHISFIFFTWFPENLHKNDVVSKMLDPNMTKCFGKKNTISSPRLPNLIAKIIAESRR